MSNMLRKKSTKWFGCCDHCARNVAIPNKPGPRERHQARAVEKRQWRRDARDD